MVGVRKDRRWLQKAIKRPGRVKRYLMRIYGPRAFTYSGEVKQKYVYMAIRRLKRMPPSKRPPGLLNALQLAKRLERMKKGK